MANANGWGDGASNNNIGWGKGANNAIGWGDIHADSYAGLTDIVGTAAFSGLLDTYSGATAAYSVRRLSSSYTGNLIRVRRSSDNAEQDISYDLNNVLDETALLAFVGANDGFVTTWYDQSGNTRNATNTTANKQPKIVSAGSILTQNSKPNINFTAQCLKIGTQVNLNAASYITFAGKSSSTAAYSSAGILNYDASDDPSLRFGAGSGNPGNEFLMYFNGGYAINAQTSGTTYSLFTHTMTGSYTATLFRNATQIATGTRSGALSNVLELSIGRYTSDSLTRNGDMQELIIWASDQSSNRTGISDNIKTYFSIY